MNRNPNLIRRSATVMVGRFRSAIFDSLGITLMEPAIALAMYSSAGTAALSGVGAARTSSDRASASAVARTWPTTRCNTYDDESNNQVLSLQVWISDESGLVSIWNLQ